MIGIKKALNMLYRFDVLDDHGAGDYEFGWRFIEHIKENDPKTAKYLENFNESNYLFQGFCDFDHDENGDYSNKYIFYVEELRKYGEVDWGVYDCDYSEDYDHDYSRTISSDDDGMNICRKACIEAIMFLYRLGKGFCDFSSVISLLREYYGNEYGYLLREFTTPWSGLFASNNNTNNINNINNNSKKENNMSIFGNLNINIRTASITMTGELAFRTSNGSYRSVNEAGEFIEVEPSMLIVKDANILMPQFKTEPTAGDILIEGEKIYIMKDDETAFDLETGITAKKSVAKNMFFKQAVVYRSMLKGMDLTSIMPLIIMNGGDFSAVMPMLMMSQMSGNAVDMSSFASNPLMMMAMMGGNQGGNMMQSMMMMQMMQNGGFQQPTAPAPAPAPAAKPATTRSTRAKAK